MSVLSISAAHLRRQAALGYRAARDVLQLWAAVDRQDISGSWRASLPAVRGVVDSAQAIAAASSGPYVHDVLAAYEAELASDGAVRPESLAGIASDGRSLDSLLYQPAVATLFSLSRGEGVERSMATGRFALETIVRTQVADAGRTGDSVAMAARPAVKGWARALTVPSCSRCVLLAGRVSRWNVAFKRHPGCDCRMIPAVEDVADDLITDPMAYFNSLDAAEQDRVFTAAGAQAIREGADISRVVNARAGMSTATQGVAAGLQVTTTGARRRIRLMPEAIFKIAEGNRDEAIRLLRVHRYLT